MTDSGVCICGAGIGGLTLGLALKKYGIPFRVYERASGLSEVGAGITLWSNAMTVLEHLGVAERIRAVAESAGGGVIGLHDGRPLVQMSEQERVEFDRVVQLWAVHRIELQRALLAALSDASGGDAVRFSATFRSYRQLDDEVRVEFDDGTETSASLLVGADGIHSRVRTQLRGEEPCRYSGYVCWRAICPIPAGWGRTLGEFWGVGDRFGVVRVSAEHLYWFAVVSAERDSETYQGSTGDAAKRFLSQRFARYQYDVPEIIAATPADSIIYRDISDRPPVRGWSARRVTLLGDAIHPTTPNMGQGAAMAIESAMVLARSLAEHGIDSETALSTYERVRFARAAEITKTSWTLGRMAHWENPVARGFRNTLFRMLPASVRLRQLTSVGGYDAVNIPLEA